VSAIVIDTNVLMVANEEFPPEQADEDCVRGCIDRLSAIRGQASGEKVVLDQDERLLKEYCQTLRSGMAPSTGHAFLYWLFQAGYNPGVCDRVQIHCEDEDNQVFAEFPNHPGLADFDISDRKFVATANAHPSKPAILQAVDAKWRGWEQALRDCDLRIEWVSEETADRLYAEHLANL
jgi:hypothetical protein